MPNKVFYTAAAVQIATILIGISALVYASKQADELKKQQSQIAEVAKVIGAAGIVENVNGKLIINKVVRVSDIQQDRPNPIPE